MGLPVVVVGILPQEQNADALIGRDAQRVEDICLWGKDGMGLALLDEKGLQTLEVGLLGFAIEYSLPRHGNLQRHLCASFCRPSITMHHHASPCITMHNKRVHHSAIPSRRSITGSALV